VQPALRIRARAVPEQLVYICAHALYHVFALTVNCLGGLPRLVDVLIANPETSWLRKELAKYRSTYFPGVNTLFNRSPKPDFRSSISRPCASRTAAAWRTAGGGREVDQAHRRAGS